jgi:two-component system, OmpR family, phosphate regulon sensor histidine kinase PhoR
MKRPRSYVYHILIFILAQIAWLSLLGIWIYWYVSNYIIFSEVGDNLSAQIMSEGRNVLVLVSGLVLLIVVSLVMSLQFYRLNMQYNLTKHYDNFIANVTHELKSPLASIQLALETMQFHDLKASKQKEFISMMLKDTQRLNNLINAILEISAMEQKKIAHDFRIYSIDPLIRELVQECREQFNLAEDSIRIHGGSSCRCVADRNAIKIVLDNLIDNAMKYSYGPVEITIHMACKLKIFRLDFNDRGIGISNANQKKIFEKFYRIQSKKSPNVKGTGLGLYWVREIIHIHGGDITVSSRGAQPGTTFHIELPIYQVSKNRYIRNLLKIAQNRKRQEEADDE